MTTPADRRVLLLGLDGACLSVVEPLVHEGAIPTLRKLFDAGMVAPLASQLPPWTPSAWPSLYTGVNPGRHGVYGFLAFDGYDWRVVDRRDVHEHALWELLDLHGLSSVVVNAPVTHPPRPIDGAVVPGYVAPENPTCHPPGLLEDIRDAVVDYRVYAPEPEDREDRIAGYRELVEMRGEAFCYLCERFDPAFGFLQFQQTDTVFHELPGDDEAVREVYTAVDTAVERVLDAWDPDTVIVASDHGIGPYNGYEFRVNTYLHDHDYLETRGGGTGMPSWSTIARTRLRDGDDGERPSQTVLERGFAALASVGLTSQRIGHVLQTVGLDGLVLQTVPLNVVRAATEQVDFPASQAYMRSRIECGVRLNIAGREPDGVVPETEYESVRDELVSLLEAATTPEGNPVFERVLRREAVFDGPYVDRAPDIVVVPAEFDNYLSASMTDEVFGPPSERYNHKFEGLVAATGQGVDATAKPNGATLLDVAPTVLSALGVPRSDRMDGDVLPFVEPTPIVRYPTFDERNQRTKRVGRADQGVEQRLSDLGYLEGP